jgi:voltage-gated potassium channel Kch
MLPLITLFTTLYRFGRSVKNGLKDPEFEALLFLLLVILVSGTIFYHGVEGWGWLDSLYFSVVTLTTVGYGDLSPHTSIGKIFTMAYLLIGIGILFGFVNLLASHAVEENKGKSRLPLPRGLWFGAKPNERETADKMTTVE